MEAGCLALRCWAPPSRWNPTARCAALAASDSMFARRSTAAAAASVRGNRARQESGGARSYDGLLLDAGGTLLQLERPVEDTYASIGRKYGMDKTVSEIKQGFKRAFSAPWPEKLRYQGDGKAFWKLIVSEATGCSRNDYFEEVYEQFANGDAWKLPPGAHETLCHLRDARVKMAVVSNFDTRLRKLLKDLNVFDLFDAIIISSEIGYEKPDAKIFEAALGMCGGRRLNWPCLHLPDAKRLTMLTSMHHSGRLGLGKFVCRSEEEGRAALIPIETIIKLYFSNAFGGQ